MKLPYSYESIRTEEEKKQVLDWLKNAFPKAFPVSQHQDMLVDKPTVRLCVTDGYKPCVAGANGTCLTHGQCINDCCEE